MSYTLSDLAEMSIGCFSAALLFTSLRSGESGPFLDQTVGIGIFIIWSFIMYKSFMHNNHTFTHKFMINALVAIAISIGMAYIFKLATLDQMMRMNFFSSPALIVYLMGFPTGLLFEKMNIQSNFATAFVSKKR